MVLYYWDLLFGLYPLIEASSIDRTQQNRFHLMTREESYLAMLWLKNTRMMDKVQITDPSNTDENSFVKLSNFFTIMNK
jgi:hypothetical protein